MLERPVQVLPFVVLTLRFANCSTSKRFSARKSTRESGCMRCARPGAPASPQGGSCITSTITRLGRRGKCFVQLVTSCAPKRSPCRHGIADWSEIDYGAHYGAKVRTWSGFPRRRSRGARPPLVAELLLFDRRQSLFSNPVLSTSTTEVGSGVR